MKAFPVPRYVNSDGETWDSAIQGMDLRDYFAAKAMQAMIQNSASLKDTDYSFDTAVACGVNTTVDLIDGVRNIKYEWAQYYAEEAYCVADAMMKARKQ